MRQLGENQQLICSAETISDRVTPLNGMKDLTLGELLGLLVGAIGVGMCFRSQKNPLIFILLYLGRNIAIPGLGALPGWLLTAGYGIYRAYRSNQSSSHL
jgi:hypothetical protein